MALKDTRTRASRFTSQKDTVIGVARDGIIVSWSPGAERVYGYYPGEIVGESMRVLFPGGLYHSWNRTLARALRGEWIDDYQTIHLRRDGTHMDVQLSLGPMASRPGVITGVTTIVRGVAERRRTREVLRNTDQWIRAIVESAVDGIITVNEFGIIEFLNPAAERMFGYEADELLGQSVLALTPSENASRVDAFLEACRQGRADLMGRTIPNFTARTKGGRCFPVVVSVSQVTVDGRKIITGIIHDVTERQRAQSERERLLHDLNKRHRETTSLYRVGEAIRAFETLSESLQEVTRETAMAFDHPEKTQVRITLDGEVFPDRPIEDTPWKLSEDIIAGGKTRGRIDVVLLEDPGRASESPFLAEERDLVSVITEVLAATVERREAEAQVIQASKLASIGELAAGVGHEINNPVNGIMNCADILLTRLDDHEEGRQYAELIKSEAERITRIVRSLLTFSRQDGEHHSPARLCDIVEAVLSLCRKKMTKSNVTLQVEVPEELPRLNCRSESLQQVVMNLLINALHALDEKYPGVDPDKILSIRARETDLLGEPALELTIEDHGTGIAQTHIDRLFDPFFTTKGRDVGTGLGLSVSDGIVKGHRGRITVESEEGAYTRFNVVLPLRPAAAPTGREPEDS